MRDFVIRDGILEKYNGSDSIVEIPSGVVEIGVGAFSKNSSLTIYSGSGISRMCHIGRSIIPYNS